MTRDDLRALARAAQSEGATVASPPAGLCYNTMILWYATVGSLASMRALGIDEERVLLDAYFEAHVDVLFALVEARA